MDGGGPSGVKEFALYGGAPAGVVETLLKRLPDFSGVEGGLESYGTWNDMMNDANGPCEWKDG